MEFVVQAAGVADWISVLVSSPERGGGRPTVRTARPCSPGGRLQSR